MNNDLQDAIRKADLLIKEGKLKSAWKVLVPYQNDPLARKRLLWLKRNRRQALQVGQERNPKSNFRQRYQLHLIIALIVIFGLGILAIYTLSLRETSLPTVPGEATRLTPVSTGSVSPSPSVTEVSPTENYEEVGLQQQVRDWFVTVEGVNNVLSLDIDVPGNEPPLVYAEIAVNPGFNDTRIPDILVQKLNDMLNTTQYSDLVVIINDGQQIVEYMLDLENSGWNQTELSAAMLPTPESS